MRTSSLPSSGSRATASLEGFSFTGGGNGEAFGDELADLALPPADDEEN